MSTKTIKVIKRSERINQSNAEVSAVPPTPPKTGRAAAQVAAREMVATVSTWVNDFQHKRRTETKRAFESLFLDSNPQPTEI